MISWGSWTWVQSSEVERMAGHWAVSAELPLQCWRMGSGRLEMGCTRRRVNSGKTKEIASAGRDDGDLWLLGLALLRWAGCPKRTSPRDL